VSGVRDLFGLAAEAAADFHDSLDDRRVGPQATYDELVESFGGPLPGEGSGTSRSSPS
jgi:hypothetical protein